MRTADQNSYVTIFDVTLGKTVSIPRKPMNTTIPGYRAIAVAAFALAVLGLTSAAGALGSHHRAASTAQASYSVTHIKLPTMGTFEEALY